MVDARENVVGIFIIAVFAIIALSIVVAKWRTSRHDLGEKIDE
ncbi:MAG: hypothetical protein WCX17_03905 [Parcubacteria group bacterium]|jgi:hypothetical protein